MLARDARRFALAREGAGELPLGSGALAGLNWQLDRDTVARELGFDSVSANSIDAVSNRDFVLDYLAAAAICAVHMSRLAGEVVLWSSDEFGFCVPGEEFSSGSSIMPQKKNPDAAELIRAKAARIAADGETLLGVMRGLPLGYSKDMQEDKEALFDAADNLELCLEAADGMLRRIEFDRDRLADAASDELLLATDVADLLVRKGMPFREAHGVVGGLVRHSLERGVPLSELSREELASFSDLLDDEYYDLLSTERSLESKLSAGGTASARVREQLETARKALRELEATR
jgi:argininosuccinate lyase